MHFSLKKRKKKQESWGERPKRNRDVNSTFDWLWCLKDRWDSVIYFSEKFCLFVFFFIFCQMSWTSKRGESEEVKSKPLSHGSSFRTWSGKREEVESIGRRLRVRSSTLSNSWLPFLCHELPRMTVLRRNHGRPKSYKRLRKERSEWIRVTSISYTGGPPSFPEKKRTGHLGWEAKIYRCIKEILLQFIRKGCKVFFSFICEFWCLTSWIVFDLY